MKFNGRSDEEVAAFLRLTQRSELALVIACFVSILVPTICWALGASWKWLVVGGMLLLFFGWFAFAAHALIEDAEKEQGRRSRVARGSRGLI